MSPPQGGQASVRPTTGFKPITHAATGPIPWQLAATYKNTPDVWVKETLAIGQSIKNAGHRGVLSMEPAGRTSSIQDYSILEHWDATPEPQRKACVELIQKWLALDPENEVDIYVGLTFSKTQGFVYLAPGATPDEKNHLVWRNLIPFIKAANDHKRIRFACDNCGTRSSSFNPGKNHWAYMCSYQRALDKFFPGVEMLPEGFMITDEFAPDVSQISNNSPKRAIELEQVNTYEWWRTIRSNAASLVRLDEWDYKKVGAFTRQLWSPNGVFTTFSSEQVEVFKDARKLMGPKCFVLAQANGVVDDCIALNGLPV